MKDMFAKTLRFAAVGAVAGGLMASAAVAEIYKVTSIAPGMSPFVVNTAISKVVNTKVDGVEFQVRATGAATKHMVDAGMGKVDFLFGSPTINWLMVNNIGPFKDMAAAPELEKGVGMIFSYQMGPYHYVTRADSGIMTLDDMKGKTVFFGPPGGAAKNVVTTNVKAATGLTPEDMNLVEFGYDAAIQAFQDDKVDVIVLPTNSPSPSIQQFSLTKEIRLLDVPIEKLSINPATGGTVNEIAAGTYGENQMNESSIRTHGAIVNFSAGMHVDEEVVYQVTKAIWENLSDIHEAAAWMPNTITKEDGLALIASRLHPGAERYYREAGWDIPEPVVFTKGN
ncbi:TAXI family TRAP transporter solute-binding subunit [Lentibacter sp. XHP0401]|uniref:TAXI family TRAP transporter solute-binding subunit n=1 Tax=Lentibacter sp. XHP0401 TaxID=2984334 RepID=UPI0021E75B47|nr:TAXI family TRAP transporter solute-binding subunit [Lentibacter sp. XHP0401]MCV2893206.1 TAXI family TRAP transporter solute-binding subunit [Lentibacter sp. XHP0401]